jgi:uncharacterized protein YjbI with pentapeptide repeats
MPELTADVVLRKIKSGEKVERADLRGLVMPKAMLEGVSFRRCDLDGANLEGARLAKAQFKNASLREAFLSGADMRDANLENADLEGANLQGAILIGANLNRANLEGANLQGADLTGARLTHAQLDSAKLGGANLTGATLAHADLSDADLSTAKLDGADLTSVNLTDANLEEASLVNAKLRDAQLDGVNVKNANLTGADAPGLNRAPVQEGVSKRYFGKGDVLRNAALEFDSGASVEIESLFEQCSIVLGDGTELVVGKSGVLSGCQIRGAGKITIHGKFVERESPGIAGVTQLVVSSGGSLVGAVEQPAELTRFAFEPGCMLRMKIQNKKDRAPERAGAKGGRNK